MLSASLTVSALPEIMVFFIARRFSGFVYCGPTGQSSQVRKCFIKSEEHSQNSSTEACKLFFILAVRLKYNVKRKHVKAFANKKTNVALGE